MHSLRLYCDVARHRSFSRAAEEHGITQSAASQRVGALEKQLGVKLIDRSVRPLALTAAGQMFLAECSNLLDRYDGLVQQVKHLQQDPSGTVRVDAIYSAGIEWLQQVRQEVEQRYPHVRISVNYRRPGEVYDEVRARKCDLGIVSYPDRWRDVGVRHLRDEEMVAVASPEHELASRQVVEAGDLDGWTMVGFDPELPVGKDVRRYLKEHDVSPTIVNTFDNIDTIKSMVGVTRHMAILPRRTVSHEVEQGILAAVRLQPTLVRPMGVIFPKPGREGEAFSPAARAFVEYLEAHTGKLEEQDSPRDQEHTKTTVQPEASEHTDAQQLVGDQI